MGNVQPGDPAFRPEKVHELRQSIARPKWAREGKGGNYDGGERETEVKRPTIRKPICCPGKKPSLVQSRGGGRIPASKKNRGEPGANVDRKKFSRRKKSPWLNWLVEREGESPASRTREGAICRKTCSAKKKRETDPLQRERQGLVKESRLGAKGVLGADPETE